jgi:hypothetical protein
MSAPDYDSADLDAILELERSPGYALVSQRMSEELDRRRSHLETDPGDGFLRAQGQVSGLRTALAIPGILKAEIKAALKE